MKKNNVHTNDSIESSWICDNPDKVYKYTEQWIAVVGKNIVAYGNDLETVIKKARKYGNPLIKFVESSDLVVYGIYY